MPTVILRGGKNGRRVSRVVLEGSSSNPSRQLELNGEALIVSDEEFEALSVKYALEEAQFPEAPESATKSPEPPATPEPPPAEGGTEDES